MEKEPFFVPPVDANINKEPEQKEVEVKPKEGELVVFADGTTAFAKDREEVTRLKKEWQENRG